MSPDGDDGYTLIEAVIAILVMSIAVVGLFAALTNLVKLSQEHRGFAVAETGARSFAQAVQARAQNAPPLASAVTSLAATISVSDARTLPGIGAFVRIDREVLRISSIDRATGVVGVTRGEAGSVAAAHLQSALVVPAFRCPSAAQLTPDPSSYDAAKGVDPTVHAVSYWQPSTKTFVASGTCGSDYTTLCPGSLMLPECDTGLYKVEIKIATTGDARLRGIGTTTTLLVRTGST